MKYFLDTEFHEYHKQARIAGIKLGKSIPTIDLISIGIVSETFLPSTNPAEGKFGEPTERQYYAICKDFNLRDVWNSYQMESYDRMGNLYSRPKKVHWLRDNVLKSIYDELVNKHLERHLTIEEFSTFNYKNLKTLLSIFGKTKKQIAEEILDFTSNGYFDKTGFDFEDKKRYELYDTFSPEFYAYYADYDWVVLAQLFGSMMDLPKGFPMYCKDLKQTLDEKYLFSAHTPDCDPKYPKQENEHNALADARWNKKLYDFLKKN